MYLERKWKKRLSRKSLKGKEYCKGGGTVITVVGFWMESQSRKRQERLNLKTVFRTNGRVCFVGQNKNGIM